MEKPGNAIQVELQPNVREAMAHVGRAVGESCPKGVGFVLLMFDFEKTPGYGGFMNYISNAERSCMVQALRELVQKLEGAGC